MHKTREGAAARLPPAKLSDSLGEGGPMPAKSPYTPRCPRWLNWALRHSLGYFLAWYLRLGSSWTDAARAIKPPFILVSNHVTLVDAFILSFFIPVPIYWIAADGNMRSSLTRAVFRLLGAIPKSKAIPDIETIGQTVRVVRKRRGVVGLCPEGQTCWNGFTQPLIPSTSKLLKLLKVPVLASVIRGGYSSSPRWGSSFRRGRIEIEFSLLLSPSEIKAMETDEIAARLDEALAHDEEAWNARRAIRFASPVRAENLELALFMCPSCGRSDSMRSEGRRIECRSCGESAFLDGYGRFAGSSGKPARFAGVKEWFTWQRGAFAESVAEAARERPDARILSDPGVALLRGKRLRPQRAVAKGELVLYPDRLEIRDVSGRSLAIPIADMDGVGVLKKRLFEFNVGRDLYQARMPKPSASALRWHLAVEALSKPH